jgi:uncharacterized membrane protein HdeD (DUF308 family)
MTVARILGIILLVIGIVCLYFGINSSNAPLDQLVEATTGRFTRHTMGYIIGGIVMIIGGGLLFIGGRPKA